jgi:hypothetical protein
MANSRNLAGILGPTLVALSISEALNYRIWDVGIPQAIYLNGCLLFVAGVAIVRITTSGCGIGAQSSPCWAGSRSFSGLSGCFSPRQNRLSGLLAYMRSLDLL